MGRLFLARDIEMARTALRVREASLERLERKLSVRAKRGPTKRVRRQDCGIPDLEHPKAEKKGKTGTPDSGPPKTGKGGKNRKHCKKPELVSA